MTAPISITLPDGSAREYPAGTTAVEVAASIGKRLAKAAVAAAVDGNEVDLGRALHDGDRVAIVTDDTEAGRHVLRHSTAHVMAQAVTQLVPGARYSIGPAIENGFYYDFELPGGATFSDDDLAAIEARMREIIAADQPFVRSEVSADAALTLFADQPYKVEIIERVQAAASGAGDPTSAMTVSAVAARIGARMRMIPSLASQVLWQCIIMHQPSWRHAGSGGRSRTDRSTSSSLYPHSL